MESPAMQLCARVLNLWRPQVVALHAAGRTHLAGCAAYCKLSLQLVTWSRLSRSRCAYNIMQPDTTRACNQTFGRCRRCISGWSRRFPFEFSRCHARWRDRRLRSLRFVAHPWLWTKLWRDPSRAPRERRVYVCRADVGTQASRHPFAATRWAELILRRVLLELVQVTRRSTSWSPAECIQDLPPVSMSEPHLPSSSSAPEALRISVFSVSLSIMGATSSGQRLPLLVLALALALLPNVLDVVTADCAAGSSTLTTEGCSGCGEYDLCLGFSSADECTDSDCVTDGGCTYQCMSVDGNLSTLVVLIEFGGYKSSKEVAMGGYTAADLAGYPDLTDRWPSASNDDVTAVSTIDVSSAVTKFIMSGGSADVNYPQGKVASITLTSDFISTATGVTDVMLSNLDLDSETASLPSFLPSTVKHLELSNTLLSDFPAELGDLTSLQQLNLDYNYITSVDSLDVIDSLTTLSLESNSIESFTGVFVNLEYLYLGDNNLTSIPTAIFSHSHLSLLNLTGNAFESRSLTRDQADFLNSLETLLLSDSDFTVDLDCDDMDQVKVQDVTVCLSDGATTSNNRASTSSSAGVDGSDTQATSSAGSSVSTSMIVGIICGILALIAAAIIFIVYRRRRKGGFIDSKLSSTADDHFPSTTSDCERRQQSYGQLRTSTGVPLGIPMSASGVAMGIPTSAAEDDASTGVPTSGEAATTYPMSSGDAVPKKKPSTFLSVWSDPELLSVQVRVEDIEDLKQLGSGAFATVWLVRYRNSQLLASKRLRPERRTKKHTSNFVEEIKLVANFDHPNLVNFVGAAWTIESDLQMLLEYMEEGDLRRYLSSPNTPVGWTTTKFDIAIGIIEALVYLHSFVPPLVHRDLKSKNVLLSSDFKAKLSDFGASRFRSVENTMTGGVGTGRWLAPEVIRGDTDYGSAADIYSFGALLTELDTNKIPYSNARGSNGKILSDMTILHRVATGKLHPKVESDCSPALKDLVERCLVEDQAQRPPAAVIAYELRLIKKDMAAILAQASADLTLSELN